MGSLLVERRRILDPRREVFDLSNRKFEDKGARLDPNCALRRWCEGDHEQG
jgi:hypothetical protein